MPLARLFVAIFVAGVFLMQMLVRGGYAAADDGSATRPSEGRIKVLVVTGGHGFKAEPFFQLFKDNPEITYTATTQQKAAEAYERDDLYTYDAIVLYDAPSEITDAQKQRMLALFDKGIGVVVLHHALLSYQKWPRYEQIAGGKYLLDVEPNADGTKRPASTYEGNVEMHVKVVAPDHPVTAGLRDFELRDEIYRGVRYTSDITPLLTAEGQPLAWARDEGRSHVVGIIVGHGPGSYSNPNFQTLLRQSIRWVARRGGR
jgi:type 1 glutamine amidotransferase